MISELVFMTATLAVHDPYLHKANDTLSTNRMQHYILDIIYINKYLTTNLIYHSSFFAPLKFITEKICLLKHMTILSLPP